VVISDIDADACSLAWNKPLEDGGSNITNYVVEKCDLSRGDWVTATSSGGQKTSCRLGKLIPGKDYAFRIRAENRFGMSDPMQSERMVAKFPFGQFTCYTCRDLFSKVLRSFFGLISISDVFFRTDSY